MTLSIDTFLAQEPYGLRNPEVEKLQSDFFSKLTSFHYERSEAYRRMLNVLGTDHSNFLTTSDVPFLPVSLFKELELLSTPRENIIKSMTSSGTSGQKVSKIFLDKETASNQVKVLSKIVSVEIGKKRLPLIIIDSESVIKDRKMFSARGAGILGFSMFGQDRLFALDSEMNLDLKSVEDFIRKYHTSGFLVFGFTFMVWEHFAKELEKKGRKIDLSNATLIHGGGWKRLIQEGINNSDLKRSLATTTGMKKISDYYGMVEQTGSVFMECSSGFLHTNVFNNVHIRESTNFENCEIGTTGIIQVMSVLPFSYPGHSILTEDLGTIFGVDDCKCGKNGKRFLVHGRVKNAEIRGCSDTYASEF
jgi:phenylacetate-coenzyme A ligase PaaK-like adenylate-forming protein